MKITCQACAAKYTIADDKVQGKIVKIRCKKCGATIVVNGNDPAAPGSDAQGGEAARFDYASQGGGGDQWTVNVADGDQRTMTDGEIVAAYHAGVVTDETFAWKDGMGDWLALREIEQLYAQCTATRAMPAPSTLGGGGIGGKPAADDDDDGDYATKVQESPMSAGGAGGGSRVPQPPANGYADAAPLAARRANARAPAADLFGSAAQAGSEEDVMTSAPAGMPQAHAAPQGGVDDKLTGQRNENSVLFSLNALTSKGGPSGGGLGGGGHSMPAGSEASGLIDIRQLSNQMGLGEDKKKKSRIDDIMNLGGGGAFAPSLGAPVLSAPPIEEYAPAPEATAAGAAVAAPQGKNRMVIFGAIGAGVLVIAGAIGVATMLMKGGSETDKDKAAASASASALAMTSAGASASAAPMASASAAPAATDSAAAVASAAPTDSSAAGAAPTTTATAKPASTTTPASTAAAAAAAATTAAPTAAAAATTAPAATAAAAAAGGADQPFNMGAAKASLGGIAGGAQACKKGDASGSGRATVTFAPSGAVQSVTVEGFESNAGTTACVSRMFRGARVPPFSGSPFSVRKSFSIN